MSLLKQVKTSREHFITQAAASDNPEIQRIANAVKSGQRNLADWALYSIVDASGKTLVRFFESQDREEIGIKNVATARLEKGEVFMPTAIQLLSATDGGADPFDADLITTLDYGVIGGRVANGEWRMEVNSQIIVPRSSNQVFVSTGWNVPTGLYILENPKIMEDNVPLVIEVETKAAIAARTALKVVLWGTVAVPA